MKKPEPKLESKAKAKKYWLGSLTKWLWVAAVVLLIFDALIANSQAASGRQLAKLQDKQSTLSTTVDQLERQVAAAGSLQKILQQATDQLGMQPVDKNVLYLSLPTPVPTGVSP